MFLFSVYLVQIKKESNPKTNFHQWPNNPNNVGEFAKTNPQLDFNPKLILKLESNAKLT